MKLHATEASVLVELWTNIKNYIPVKDQRAAADQYIIAIDDAGLVDLTVVSQDLYGVCEVFDKALRDFCQEHGSDFEDDDLDWDE